MVQRSHEFRLGTFSLPPQGGNISSCAEEQLEDRLLFGDAIALGADWIEATNGADVNQRQFMNLHAKGYVSASTDDVARFFYDWTDYQCVSSTEYQFVLAQRAEKQAKILQAINDESQLGLIPEEFFYPQQVEMRADLARKEGEYPHYYLVDGLVDPAELIERYARFSLINHFMSDYGCSEISDGRLLNTSLGFNPLTGKASASLRGSLVNKFPNIKDFEIEEAAEDLDIFEFVFPNYRTEHLEELLVAGTGPLYNTRSGKQLPRLAVLDYAKQGGRKSPNIRPLTDELESHPADGDGHGDQGSQRVA